jgi:hypothetical protein
VRQRLDCRGERPFQDRSLTVMGIGLRFGFGPLRFFIPLTRRRRRRRRAPARRSTYYHHGTCTIHHKTPGAAQRCKGRV